MERERKPISQTIAEHKPPRRYIARSPTRCSLVLSDREWRYFRKLAAELREKIRYKRAIACVEVIQNGKRYGEVPGKFVFEHLRELRRVHLILAVPAYVMRNNFWRNASPNLASKLKAIEYAPVCAVGSVYGPFAGGQITLDGFGYMVPRGVKGLETICTSGNSSLFPGRAPEGTC